MSVTSSMTTARQALIDKLDMEFGPDGFKILGDNLHRSLGRDGNVRIGVSPSREIMTRNNRQLNEHRILVQFYGAWSDTIDPTETVDPSWIEQQSERFKRMVRTSDPDQANMWFFVIDEITYPDDPTGNRTRFEANVIAFGSNSSLVETTG